MKNSEQAELRNRYNKADNRLVLLDYDGTLVDYELIPENASLPDHLADTLIRLNEKPGTRLFIISGRCNKDIEKIAGTLPVGIIAEHGAMIKENGIWKNQITDKCVWKDSIIPVLESITLSCPGSFLEEKNYSLSWHYRSAEPVEGYQRSRELIRNLKELLDPCNLKILDGNKIVEVMTKGISKGVAVNKLLNNNNYDFILSIGDDVTDEEMFEYLINKNNAFTVKVGEGPTFAKFKIDSVSDVKILLKQLSE
jgi:trehalose 6-phosphate synthase/phosphatase